MPSASIVKHGKKYRVIWREGGRGSQRHVSEGFKQKSGAEAERERIIERLRAAEPLGNRTLVPIGEVLNRWLLSRKAELGPRKQFQAEIDGRRIERVDRLRQVGDCRILGVQISCLGDQHLGEVGEDAPVPLLVRIGQGRARDGTTNPQVVEFGRNSAEAGLDIPQALPAGQLRKRHAQELVQVGEGPRGTPVRISIGAPAEFPQGQQVHDLREHQPACKHDAPCQGAGLAPEGHSPTKSFHLQPCISRGVFHAFRRNSLSLVGQQ